MHLNVYDLLFRGRLQFKLIMLWYYHILITASRFGIVWVAIWVINFTRFSITLKYHFWLSENFNFSLRTCPLTSPPTPVVCYLNTVNSHYHNPHSYIKIPVPLYNIIKNHSFLSLLVWQMTGNNRHNENCPLQEWAGS